MSLTRARHVFKNFTDTVTSNPWLYGSMIFFALVSTAAAASQMQSVIDLLSQEGGENLGNLLSTEKLAESMQEAIKGQSIEQICGELNSYLEMCRLFSADFVTVEGSMEVSDCGAGEVFGQSSNPTAMVCNAAKLVMKLLPQETLEACGETVKEAARSMGLTS